MNRKILAVLLALLLIPAALSAAPFFQIGPLVSYNRTIVEMEEGGEDLADINNFSFGADVRLTPLRYLSIDIPATFGIGSHGSFSIAAIPTVNLNIPVAGIVDIALGAGTQFDFQYAGESKDWTMYGLPMDSAADAFQHSKLVYRLGVTVNLGFISVGANALLPGQSGFGDGDIGGIFNPMWESTRFSVVALFNLG